MRRINVERDERRKREALTAHLQVTLNLIDSVKAMTLKAGLGGFDINKKGTPMGEKKV